MGVCALHCTLQMVFQPDHRLSVCNMCVLQIVYWLLITVFHVCGLQMLPWLLFTVFYVGLTDVVLASVYSVSCLAYRCCPGLYSVSCL